MIDEISDSLSTDSSNSLDDINKGMIKQVARSDPTNENSSDPVTPSGRPRSLIGDSHVNGPFSAFSHITNIGSDQAMNTMSMGSSPIRGSGSDALADADPDITLDSVDEGYTTYPLRRDDETDDAISVASSSSSIPPDLDSDSKITAESDAISGLDDLLSKMTNNLVIRDVAVQVPSTIAVPQGYTLIESTSPDSHYWAQRLVKMHVKRKRSEGVLAKPSIRSMINERYGFLSEEINSSGTISTQDCHPSQLTNEIHPFLSRSRFDDTPDAIYDQLVPALRLASMCLTQPVCMQYWVTLALGERKHDEEMSRKYGSYCQRIDHHVEMTDENIALVSKELEDLASENLVLFVFRHRDAMLMSDVWACSHFIWENRAGRKKNLTKSLVRLHTDYYTVAKKLSQLKYPEHSQVLRFSLHFAILLLHELAHSIDFAYQNNRCYGRQELHTIERYMEPFFLDSKSPPECGRFLEQVMFGGEIQPINKRTDGSHGLCISEWPPQSLTADSERRQWHTVPMDYVESLFLAKTWQGKSQLRDYTALHVPRTGTTAIYINSCTTMDWSKSDEAAEALVLAKAQPACKKRLTATGVGEDQRGEEDAAISFFFWELEAIRMEEVSRRFGDSPSSRRHSFHVASAEEEEVAEEEEDVDGRVLSSRPKKMQRRSRSLAIRGNNPSLSQEEYDIIAEDLRRNFQASYDKLPAHKEPTPSTGPVPTSEIVKGLRRGARRSLRLNPPPTPNRQNSPSPVTKGGETLDVRDLKK